MKTRYWALFILAMPIQANAASRAWIAEFATTHVEAPAPIANLPAIIHQSPIDLSSGTSKRSATFDQTTRFIRVICEVQCAIQAGANATNSAIILPPSRPEYFGVTGGTIISVIAMP